MRSRPISLRLFLRCVALLVQVACLVVVASGSPAGAQEAVVSPTRARYVVQAPVRAFDSRPGGIRVAAGTAVTLSVETDKAVATVAVVVNLTMVQADGAGFLTAYPADRARPGVSNVNASWPGQTVASLATVAVDEQGRFTVYASVSTDLIVDVLGRYTAANLAHGGRFMALEPTRALDTRNGDPLAALQHRTLDLTASVPADASAVVLNVTATRARSAGFLTLWAAGDEQPNTSNLNISGAGDTVANQVIVPTRNGAVEIFSQATTDALVDVDGYYTGESAPLSGDGLFVAVTPYRLLDTRAAGELNPVEDRLKPRKDWTLEVAIAHRGGVPAGASAVALTATVVHAEGAGFAAVWPAGQRQPVASSLNSINRGQTVANHVMSRVSLRGVGIYTSTPMHLLLDVSGWFTGTAALPTLLPPAQVLPVVSGRIDIPALGVHEALGDGTEDVVLDQGPMHWSYSSLPGELGTMFVLGHRSSHGGPFLRLGELVAGDIIELTNGDQRATYRVTGHRVVQPEDVLALAEPGTANLMLVACHPIGSTEQRLVVRAELVTG